MTEKRKFKIKPKKLDSSDCVVHVGQVIENDQIVDQGEAYNIHQDERVEILPVVTMKESFALMSISNLDDTPDAEGSLKKVCDALSERVMDWNWTDNNGEPLPKPYKNPDVFQNLLNEELIWLITSSLGETPSERKNDLEPSQNTQSVVAQSNQQKG